MTNTAFLKRAEKWNKEFFLLFINMIHPLFLFFKQSRFLK